MLSVGAGELGSAGGRAAAGVPLPGFTEMHRPEALHALLPRGDFVVVVSPSTAETDGMFGPAEYDAMRPGAVPDVFDPEPLPAASELWAAPNLIITPHCSSDDATGYIPATPDLVLDNAGRLLRGETLRNMVDLRLQY